jgi:uncharacterized protein
VCVSISWGIIFSIISAAPSEAAEIFPKPVGAVNDFARVIPPDDKNRMEDLAGEVLAKTGTAIVIATVESLGDNELNDYVNSIYKAWGVGKKGEDKGVLIFLALKERKFRIETGYGVEGILPDGLVGEIRDRYVIPYLKKGDYGKGLSNAMTAVANIVAKNANVSLDGGRPEDQPREKKDNRGIGIVPLIIIILILISIFGTSQGRDLLPWLLLILFGGGGRGGGFDGGGNGGFGSFGGGGFGGFGGGESGGGGASGDF